MDNSTVIQLVGKMEKRELIQLIGHLVQMNSAAEQSLLEYCQKKPSPANKNLVNEKLLIKLWKNALAIIDEANTYGGCDENDEDDAGWELEEITKLVQGNDISWDCRRTILDEMMIQIAYDNSGFTDILVDTAEVFCRTNDEKAYFANHLAKNGSSYYKKYAASIYCDIGDVEKSLIIKKANLEYSEDYLDLARYYDEQGDNNEALKIVREGYEKCTGSLDGIYKYLFKRYQDSQNEKAIWNLYDKAIKKQRDIDCISELMYEHCKQKGDYTGQKNMLHQLLESCRNDAAKKWYEQCQKDFSQFDWHKEESTLLGLVKKKSITAYLDICLGKGDKRTVLDHITKTPSSYFGGAIDIGHRYSKLLAQDYPNEILTLYWSEVHSLIRMSKDKHYESAASTLKEIKTIMKKNELTDEWDRLFCELKDIHRRRKNFLKTIVNL